MMCSQPVVVQSDGNIVGHISRKISCICMLFICRGGVLNCLITGSRRYSRNLPQGGIVSRSLHSDGVWNVRDAGIIHEIRENFIPRKFPPIRYAITHKLSLHSGYSCWSVKLFFFNGFSIWMNDTLSSYIVQCMGTLLGLLPPWSDMFHLV